MSTLTEALTLLRGQESEERTPTLTDALAALRSGAGGGTLPVSPSLRDSLSFFKDRLQPSLGERTLRFTGDLVVEVAKDVADIPRRTFSAGRALSKVLTTKGSELDLTPEESEDLFAFGLDLVSFKTAGLLRAGAQAARNPFIKRFLAGTAVGAVLPSREEAGDPLARIGSAATVGLVGGVAEPVLAKGVQLAGKGLSKLGLGPLTPQKATKAVIDQYEKLKDRPEAFIFNVVPRVNRHLLRMQEALDGALLEANDRVTQKLAKASGRLPGSVGKAIARETERLTEKVIAGSERGIITDAQRKLIEELARKRVGAGVAKITPVVGAAARNQLLREEVRKLSDDTLKTLTSELELSRGLLEGLRPFVKEHGKKMQELLLAEVGGVGPVKFNAKAGERMLDSMLGNANRLIRELNSRHVRSVNSYLALRQRVETYFKGVLALQGNFGPQSTAKILSEIASTKGVKSVEFWRTFVSSYWVPNLFSPVSFVLDSIGNAMKIGTDFVAKGGADLVDVLMGSQGASRLGATINSVRNRQMVKSVLDRNIKSLFAAGEPLPFINAPAVTVADKALRVAFTGARLKSFVDTQTRRYFAATSLFEQAYQKATQRGLRGAEREMFVHELLANPDASMVTRAVLVGNEGAFIVPRSAGFVRFADDPWVRLFVSPFIKFGLAWTEYLASVTPGLGFAGLVKEAARGRGIPAEQFRRALAKQLTGAGAISMVDRTLYDDVQIDSFGRPYMVSETGRRRVLPSPLSDLLFLSAAIRGDWDKALRLAPGTGITMLSPGLLLKPLSLILADGELDETKLAQVGRELEESLSTLVPGQTILRILADTLGGETEESAFGRLVNVGDAKLRVGGGVQSSKRRLRGLDVPVAASFGAILTEEQLNDAEQVFEILRRETGRDYKPLQVNFPIRPRGGAGVEVSFRDLDREVQRFIRARKQERLAEFLEGLPRNPQWRGLSPAQKERQIQRLEQAASLYARAQAQAEFADRLDAVGALVDIEEVGN